MNPSRHTISQRFFFDAAHTLQRDIEAEGSRRIHGHTYWCEISVSGHPDPGSGMVMDLGFLRERIGGLREKLDHHHLNEVPGLGIPTLENLCSFIAHELSDLPVPLSRVIVWRDSIGDRCELLLA
jgi:6-pyruvoyltetrahydropterin/6-carboxytetrahydropterin synthase